MCDHKNTEYIPEDPETNVQENYICLDCGETLDIPEPDWDLMRDFLRLEMANA